MKTAIDSLKKTVKKYRHAWVLLYGFIYFPWFTYLERHNASEYFFIHSPLDDYIPFVEYFIVPYLLWFGFIAAALMYFLFTDKEGFYKLTAFLFTGMTIFLIICTIFPNALQLRPETFARDNIFVDMVRALYRTDTPTNVLPSMHVFNSLGVAHCYLSQQGIKKASCDPDQFLLSGRTHHSVNGIFKTTFCHRCDRSLCTCLHYLPTGLCDSTEEDYESGTTVKLKNEEPYREGIAKSST